MRRTFLLLLLGLLAPVASVSRSAHVRRVYEARLASVTPRQGMQHRSLIIVALVGRDAGGPSGLLVDPTPLDWAPADAKCSDFLAALSWREGAADPDHPPVLLPSGLVLRAGAHERLLQRPALLKPGAVFVARSTSLILSTEATGAADAGRTIGGVAPPEFGHTLFLLHDREALTDLPDLEAAALGQDPKTTQPSLAALAAEASVKARIDTAAKAVRVLGSAYGGDTVGHVAFLGEGVVQLVLTGAPGTYRSYVDRAADGLGLAVATWESLYGAADDPLAPARWDDYVSATARLLEHLRFASFKPERRLDESGEGRELWRVRATKATRSGRPPDVGWLRHAIRGGQGGECVLSPDHRGGVRAIRGVQSGWETLGFPGAHLHGIGLRAQATAAPARGPDARVRPSGRPRRRRRREA